MKEQNRYFLESDPKIVGEGAFAIRKRTTLLDSGIASVKFRRGLLDTLSSTEEEKIQFILNLVNKLDEGIERTVRIAKLKENENGQEEKIA